MRFPRSREWDNEIPAFAGMAALLRYDGTFNLLIRIHHSGESRNLLARSANGFALQRGGGGSGGGAENSGGERNLW
ncbi:MAG: hypothetical protein ACR2QC_11215 [Gammaproteobacteria bacterium]